MKHFALCATRCESTEENKNKQIQTIMNTNNKNNVWAVETYETPTIATLNIQSEGVLCGSGEFGINDWENDSESLDF